MQLMMFKMLEHNKKRIDVLLRGYFSEGESSFNEIVNRVSKTACNNNPELEERFSNYMKKEWFIPASPILSNLGAPNRNFSPSCYLIKCEDSVDGIMSSLANLGFAVSNGGGVGIDISSIRGIGEKIVNKGVTCGIKPFIKSFETVSQSINQGSLRRGSVNLCLRIDHPEIEDFIKIRSPIGNFEYHKALRVHITVIMNKEFIKAVEENTKFKLKRNDGSVAKTLNARALYTSILHERAVLGEPFITMRENIDDNLTEIEKGLGNTSVGATNLCTEIFQKSGKDHLNKERIGVCVLGQFNLSTFEEWGAPETLEQFIQDITDVYDNLVTNMIDLIDKTISSTPDQSMSRIGFLKSCKYSMERERSIGLGCFGFANYLIKRGIPYESKEAVEAIGAIWKKISSSISRHSHRIAHEKGACLDSEEYCSKKGVKKTEQTFTRFLQKTAIAPTSNVSKIFNCVQGIDPLFSNIYVDITKHGTETHIIPELIDLIKSKSLIKKQEDELIKDIMVHKGSIQQSKWFTQREKEIFKTSSEIDPNKHLDLVIEAQKYISQGISFTVRTHHAMDKKFVQEMTTRAIKSLKTLYYSRLLNDRESDLQIEKEQLPEPEVCVDCDG